MPATVFTATLGSLTLNQVRSSAFNANGQAVEGVTSGAVDVSQYFGGQIDFRATFESGDLASVAAVSNVGTAGIAVSSGTITIPYQVRANKGTFAAGGSHYSLSGTDGLIWPTSFALPAGGDASASLECLFLSSDGDTIPVSVNTGVTLSAETFQSNYTLGPVSVNGTALSNVTGVTVTTGIEVTPVFYRFNYAPQGFIVRRRPMIDITFYDLDTLNALGAGWGTGTACVVYARKRAVTGFVADITAEHIAFSFADGLVQPVQNIAGEGVGGNSTRTLRFMGESLTVTGSSAIT